MACGGRIGKWTQKEADKVKLPLALCNRWQFIMDLLWDYFTKYSKAEPAAKVSNIQNKIYFKLHKGLQFKIWCNFINSSYLQLVIEPEEIDNYSMEINGIDSFSTEGIIKIVAEFLTHADKL